MFVWSVHFLWTYEKEKDQITNRLVMTPNAATFKYYSYLNVYN